MLKYEVAMKGCGASASFAKEKHATAFAEAMGEGYVVTDIADKLRRRVAERNILHGLVALLEDAMKLDRKVGE
tara:strand:- start:6061 stop:6279 length:219 start_codon:yes stop_codon:yes gene_type:complete